MTRGRRWRGEKRQGEKMTRGKGNEGRRRRNKGKGLFLLFLIFLSFSLPQFSFSRRPPMQQLTLFFLSYFLWIFISYAHPRWEAGPATRGEGEGGDGAVVAFSFLFLISFLPFFNIYLLCCPRHATFRKLFPEIVWKQDKSAPWEMKTNWFFPVVYSISLSLSLSPQQKVYLGGIQEWLFFFQFHNLFFCSISFPLPPTPQ